MDINKTIVTKTAAETAGVGVALAASLIKKKGSGSGATVICLYGDLGSGKTTFVRGFAKGLGLKTRLPSPTFIIVRRYQIPTKLNLLYHVDLYRTKTTYDIENLGFSEMLEDPHAFVLIEWAEKLERLVPQNRIDIHCTVNEDDSHTIKIG